MDSFQKVFSRDNRVLEIHTPKDGELRCRKVISRSNSKSTLKYPGWKVGRMVHCESINELNVFYLLDADTEVNDFKEQPFKIIYLENGEKKLHYPDVLVERNKYLEILEIKEDLSKEPQSLFKRTEILSESLQSFGYSYRLVCGKEIKKDNVKLSNAKYLLLHGRMEAGLINYEKTRQFFIEKKQTSWGIYLACQTTENSLGILCNLILKGFVSYDDHCLIGAKTELYWNGKLEESQ